MAHKIPKGAMRFVETNPECFAIAEKFADDKPPKLKMVGYSGGLIKGHWYWGDLIIDLQGMIFPLSKYPVLEDHWTEKKIAFTGKPITSNGKLELNPETSKFLDTEVSLEFQKNSLAGFPYQSSIYARPSVVERLSDGEKAEVNGMTVKGPASIWRKSTFKECSACVFGWDGKTQASAFSKTEMEEVDIEYLGKGGDDEHLLTDKGKQTVIDTMNKSIKEVSRMDLAQLKNEHPKIVDQLTEEVTQSVTDTLTVKFDAEKATFESKLAKKDEQINAQDDRLADLEKNDAIRTANEFKAQADRIFDSKLNESVLAESLHEKVRKMINHDKFVKEGVLDKEAFATAVDAEIKDWEDKLVDTTPSVQGFGKTFKKPDGDNENLSQENEDTANGLLSLVGQKQTK